MKKHLILPVLMAGTMLAISVSAHAADYRYSYPLKGMKPALAPGPEEPTEPEDTWALASATLPKAIANNAYSYSFYDLITPASLDGFTWQGQSLPSWAALDPNTGEITGTPSNSDIGDKSFAITATRNGTDGQQIYTIVVGGQTLEVTQISAGGTYTCAVTSSGAAMCWGKNSYGQLGTGNTTDSRTPVVVNGLSSGVASISAGQLHTCAVTTSGGAYCWGENSNGQLGTGNTTDRFTPSTVSGLSTGAASISVGGFHTCAVTTSGGAVCWGSNSQGRLGHSSSNTSTPSMVTGLTSGVASITAGGSHSCALTTGGAVKCWGANISGQLGNGTNSNSSSSVAVTGLSSGVTSISAGSSHTCAVTTSGAAKCWGGNSEGQLGNGTTISRSTPVSVGGLGSGVTGISAGSNHTCATTSSGTAKCWGMNVYGELGNSSTTGSSVPVDVTSPDTHIASITANGSHTCAVTSDGVAKCWGWNGYGQLGTESTANSSVPAEVDFAN